MSDHVNHPTHYTTGGVETIDILKAKLTNEEFKGYLKGCIIKYMTRALHKGTEGQDYRKAQWYLNYLIDWETKQHGDAKALVGDGNDRGVSLRRGPGDDLYGPCRHADREA